MKNLSIIFLYISLVVLGSACSKEELYDPQQGLPSKQSDFNNRINVDLQKEHGALITENNGNR